MCSNKGLLLYAHILCILQTTGLYLVLKGSSKYTNPSTSGIKIKYHKFINSS